MNPEERKILSEIREKLLELECGVAKNMYPEGILEFGGFNLIGTKPYQEWVEYHMALGTKITKVKNSLGEILEVGKFAYWGFFYFSFEYLNISIG